MISNIRDSVDNCLRRTIKNINEKKYSKKNFRSNRETYENSSVVVLISLRCQYDKDQSYINESLPRRYRNSAGSLL